MRNQTITWCRGCGDESAVWRPSKRQALCASCNAETPRKASRASFERRYWGVCVDDVPHGTRCEFYADYLASELNLTDYIGATSVDISDHAAAVLEEVRS